MLVTALALAALAAAVGRAGFWYGEAWIEWDPVASTNFYTERPGGFVTLALTQSSMLVMFLIAVGLAIAAIVGLVSLYSTRASSPR